MATLKIRKSENEFIELPLTTEKPIARSLAVFLDGKVYYCPLVYKGSSSLSPAPSIGSGVTIRVNGSNYQLATEIYDPITYDNCRDTWYWYKTGNYVPSNILYERGKILFLGRSHLSSQFTINPVSEGGFYFETIIEPMDLSRNFNQYIFSLFNNGSVKLELLIDTNDKLCLKLNGTALITTSYALEEYNSYRISVSMSNNSWTLKVNNTTIGTKTAAMTSADYSIILGAGNSGNDFTGMLSSVIIAKSAATRSSAPWVNLRFGD